MSRNVEELAELLRKLGRHTPTLARRVDEFYHPALNKLGGAVSRLQEKMEETDTFLGDLDAIIDQHGSAGELLSKHIYDIEDLMNVQEELTEEAEELKKAIGKLERDAEVMTSNMELINQLAIKRSKLLDARMHKLERFNPTANRSPRTNTRPSITNVAPPTTSNNAIHLGTVVGQVAVGGTLEDVSLRSLFVKIQSLENHNSVQTQRLDSSPVKFESWSFGSEPEFEKFYDRVNPNGEGLASMVCFNTIWTHSSMTDTAVETWLQQQQRSVATGFKNTIETDYISALRNRYPFAFVGKVDSVLPTHVIKAFGSLDTWRGTGVSDGTKERLQQSLALAKESHRLYCQDNLGNGPLRDMAIRSGEFTTDFITKLFSHLDDEITMLTSLGVDQCKVMLLCTHQLLQISDATFKFRQKSAAVDLTDKGAAGRRFASVTLKSLAKMKEFSDCKFKDHPAINGTFIRFLTRQTADNSSLRLSMDIRSLGDKVDAGLKREQANRTKGIEEAKKKASQVDQKLESVIKANSLKKA